MNTAFFKKNAVSYTTAIYLFILDTKNAHLKKMQNGGGGGTPQFYKNLA